MRPVLVACPAIFLAFLTVQAEPGKKESVAEIRAKYAKQSAAVLKIAEPIKVSDVFYWKDGGSLGIELTDANKKKHLFCFDGRTKASGKLFVGVNYPGPAGKEVEIWGPEESALYAVMLRWVNKHE